MTDARIYSDPEVRTPSRLASGLLERTSDRRARILGRSQRGVLERLDVGALVDAPIVDAPGGAPHSTPHVQDVFIEDVAGVPLADQARVAASTRRRSLLALVACGAVTAAAVALGVAVLGRSLGLAAVTVALVALVIGYRFVVQPWHVRWGATDAEVDAALPGDELLQDAPASTRAVTVDAPVEQVWEWLVQLGIGPNGWTARGLIDDGDLGGDRVAPLLRNLGRSRAMPGAGFEVHRIESPSTIVSQGSDGTSWCLHLLDAGQGRSRLISRFRSRFDLVPGSSIVLADPAAFVAERRMLRDLKARAEGGAPLERLECPCVP